MIRGRCRIRTAGGAAEDLARTVKFKSLHHRGHWGSQRKRRLIHDPNSPKGRGKEWGVWQILLVRPANQTPQPTGRLDTRRSKVLGQDDALGLGIKEYQLMFNG